MDQFIAERDTENSAVDAFFNPEKSNANLTPTALMSLQSLLCKANRLYLLTKVARYCLLALHSWVVFLCFYWHLCSQLLEVKISLTVHSKQCSHWALDCVPLQFECTLTLASLKYFHMSRGDRCFSSFYNHHQKAPSDSFEYLCYRYTAIIRW